jgi:hypothetical protein
VASDRGSCSGASTRFGSVSADTKDASEKKRKPTMAEATVRQLPVPMRASAQPNARGQKKTTMPTSRPAVTRPESSESPSSFGVDTMTRTARKGRERPRKKSPSVGAAGRVGTMSFKWRDPEEPTL